MRQRVKYPNDIMWEHVAMTAVLLSLLHPKLNTLKTLIKLAELKKNNL